jgi:hypothetical protein
MAAAIAAFIPVDATAAATDASAATDGPISILRLYIAPSSDAHHKPID